MNKQFEFRQIRDFGGVLNDSFDFIKLEYKRLGKVLLFYVLPFLVVTAIINVFLQSNYISNTLNQGAVNPASPFQNIAWGSLLGSYTIGWLNYSVLSAVVLAFIKLHQSRKGEFEITEIRSFILPNFFELLVAYLVCGIISVVGLVFFIIPGIYLSIVLTLVAPILILEKNGLGNALNRSFFLIRSNWWRTFGIVFIGAIVIYFFTLVLSLPIIITTFIDGFHAAQGGEPVAFFTTGYFAMTAVISVVQTLAYSLLVILCAINYFSLVEEKERPTLQERIDNLSSENA